MAATHLSVRTNRLWASWPTSCTDDAPADGELPILDSGGARKLSAEELAVLQTHSGHTAPAERPPTVLPYTRQDRYDRQPATQHTRVAVLENEHIRAEFLLELGGRLWSLIDRRDGRELLHRPSVLQPGNLALRNAWFAGGVEWNLGFTGHWALTCEPVFAGRLIAPDGTPVLRMWEYERMLGLTWRIDVWLPADASALLVRPVIANPTAEPVSVYWWSNIAVPLSSGSRVLAPADNAWHFGYAAGLQYTGLNDPMSYPASAPHSADYFYDLHNTTRPWICAVDATDRGLVQASTPRLRGRKLFVWGDGTGGRHWQQWLGGDPGYTEIQAGLARTQLEHLPLPAGDRWAWTEAYAPVHVPGATTAGWADAVRDAGPAAERATGTQIDRSEQVLAALVDAAPEEILHTASGWGALEVAAGHRAPDPATPFPEATQDHRQQPWRDLVRTGRLDTVTAAPVLGSAWTRRLSEAAPTAATFYHLGLAALGGGDPDRARHLWAQALEYDRHALILRALARVELQAGDWCTAIGHYEAATTAMPDHRAIAVEALTVFCDHDQLDRADGVLQRLPAAAHEWGRIRYLRCRVALARGDLETVRDLLVDHLLVVPDLREGEISLDRLWHDYCTAAGEQRHLPAAYDFRMHPQEEPG